MLFKNCLFQGKLHSIEPWLENVLPWKHWKKDDTLQVECATEKKNKFHCDSNPCQNGRCIGVINDFLCICDINWKGKACNEPSKSK